MKIHKNILIGSGTITALGSTKEKNRITKAVLWTVTAFAVLSFSYPYHSGTILTNKTIHSSKNEQAMPAISDTTKQAKEIQLKITGMACTGCSNRIHDVLTKTEGILENNVSYEKGTTIIKYDADKSAKKRSLKRSKNLVSKLKKSTMILKSNEN